MADEPPPPPHDSGGDESDALPPPPPVTTADNLSWFTVCRDVFARVMKLKDMKKEARRSGSGQGAFIAAKRRDTLFPPALREAVQVRGESLYPYMRLLVPGKDVQDRGRYGMKSTRLAEAYVDRLGLGGTPDAVALKAFKASSGSGGDAENDFAAAVQGLLTSKQHGKPPSTWTVAHVNSWLDELARIGSAPKVTGKDQFPHFASIIAALSPVEHKWLVRIIMVRAAAPTPRPTAAAAERRSGGFVRGGFRARARAEGKWIRARTLRPRRRQAHDSGACRRLVHPPPHHRLKISTSTTTPARARCRVRSSWASPRTTSSTRTTPTPRTSSQ